MTATATRPVRLTKVRSHITTIEVSYGWLKESDAGWATTDGYLVSRTHDEYGNPTYWLRIRDGHFSTHDCLAHVREAIAGRRSRGARPTRITH